MSLSNSRFVALLACITLSACGGTSGGGSTNVVGNGAGTFSLTNTSTASSQPATSVASSASSNAYDSSITWTPVAVTAGNVTVVSPDTSIAAGTVVTFGQAFPAGEIPSGQVVQARLGATNLPTQTVIKRRHPDNSIRHAIISVQLPATAVGSGKASLSLSLSATGSGAAGTPLTTSGVTGSGSPDYRVELIEKSVLKDGSTATPETGIMWSATLKSSISGSTDNWISGPLASEWRARVAPTATGISGAHPGLRVIFDARYQSATQGRVSITLENVESNTARGDRLYNLRIYEVNGGTSDLVYSADDIKHYAHTRYRKLFHFGGSKDFLAIADSARLKSSRAIPNYADAPISESAISTAYSSWLASQRGLYQPASIQPYMPSTGGRWDIGPLPGWTAKAVISGDPRMYQVMLDHADRAGFWNVHWRDSLLAGATVTSADIFSVDNHPNFSLVNPSSAPDSYVGSTHMNWMGDSLPAPTLGFSAIKGYSGGYEYTLYYDTAHEPSLTFVPYIVTGDRYYLDELSFYAAWPMISYGYSYRGNALGLYKADPQVRGQAWGLRTLGHAAWIMPDGDWRKTYFEGKVNNNLNWYRTVNMVDAPLGWISANVYNTSVVPYAVPSKVANVYAPWQHSFMSYTLAELAYKGFNAADVRDWALGLTVKLFTSPDNEYNKYDGTAYYLVNKVNGAGGTTVTLSTMAQVTQYSFETRGSAPTSLDGTYAGGSAMMAFMALATAVDANVTNSSQGFVFVRNQVMGTGTSNIRAVQDEAIFNIVPFGAVTGISVAPGIYTP